MSCPYAEKANWSVRGLAPPWCVELGESGCGLARLDQRRAWGSGGWWAWVVVALRNVVGVGGNFLSWAACEGEPSDEDFDTGELSEDAPLLVAATEDDALRGDATPAPGLAGRAAGMGP